tara:strand:- start:466 stop:1083 length:618 start_codon:yes stop_codon:yes gene_type:complete
MNKNVFNLLLIIVILNSFFKVLNELVQPPLCPKSGPNYNPKCRFYILASNKTDCDDPGVSESECFGYPKKHPDSNKYFAKIVNWYIPTIIFYSLILITSISYFVVPLKVKKIISLIIVGLTILNSIINIYISSTDPPSCNLDARKYTDPKCVSSELFTNFVDGWGFPIRHIESIKFHRLTYGMKLPNLISNILLLCLSLFVLLKK